jgi:hypothetical protein
MSLLFHGAMHTSPQTHACCLGLPPTHPHALNPTRKSSSPACADPSPYGCVWPPGLRGLYRGFPTLLIKMLPTTVLSFHVSSAIIERYMPSNQRL